MATSVSQRRFGKSDVFFGILYFFAYALVAESKSGRLTYQMIYIDIKAANPCIRRMNATHQIGCTSGFHGNTGVVHLIQDEDDITWLESPRPHAPYVAVFDADQFTRPNIERMLRSKQVNGMLVDFSNNTMRNFIDSSSGYSPDRACPNDKFGMYTGTDFANCSKPSPQWNPAGNGINFDLDFGIPVFILTEEEDYNSIVDCYQRHNQRDNDSSPADYPLCSIELNDFMHGVKDTPTCKWRTERAMNLEPSHYCDPIGDKNVWGFAKNSNNSENYKSLIMAAAQLDATSLFYSNLPPYSGSESVVSSLVPLLAAAEAIGRLPKDQKNSWTRDIMFTFFNAESYDYTGSSRMAYDMMRGYFPNSPEDKDPPKHRLPQLNITDIAYYLELRQLGLADGSVYYTHVDPISQKNVHNKTEEIIQALQDNTVNITVTPVRNLPLPPASLQQFLRTGVEIPGVLITDHQREYKNKFYNSRYDIPYYVGADGDNGTTITPLATELNKVAGTVAKALVSLAGGDNSAVTSDETVVNQLLYCFLVNANCSLFRSLQDSVDADILPVGVDLYPGVDISDTAGSKLTNKLLSYYLGDKTEIKKSEKEEKCKKPEDNSIYNYLFVVGPKMSAEEGQCIISTVHRTRAVSPAFIDDAHTKPDWASTKYSTWTESQWSSNAFSIKIFLVPSPKQEWVMFSLGALVVLISFPAVYFIRARADVLFNA